MQQPTASGAASGSVPQFDVQHTFTPDQNFMNALKTQLEGALKKAAKDANVEDFSVDDADETGHDEGDAATAQEDFMSQFAGKKIIRNPPVPVLYEHALRYERGTNIVTGGALVALSGSKTGRSPNDKRIVDEASSREDVWWGPVNFKLSEKSFLINRERAVDYLNTRGHLFIIDAFAGWDPAHRIKIRIVCERAYHALFMTNMLIRPTREELRSFGKPDYTIYNAGRFPANKYTDGVSSNTSVAIDFHRREMVILGTEYAGEMKKGVLTIMMYLMMKQDALPLHSSCNENPVDKTISLFFGLSGTGKTTLSADPARLLIGDDEHVWHKNGVFNIEGGCYAKCIDLSEEKEPEIYHAIKFGAVLENVVYDHRRHVDYSDVSITENTRCAYPLEHIPNAKLPAVGGHPTNVILLTCDAFGVLPPVSKLTRTQVMYHFIAGYTAKVAGTEMGVTEPVAAFSACYGSPFLVLHPVKYAQKLADMLEQHEADAWLINTGWSGGKYGQGSRIKLKYTRAIIDAIHDGSLAKVEYEDMPVFGLKMPKECNGVPSEILNPRTAWSDPNEYDDAMSKLSNRFLKNFQQYEGTLPPAQMQEVLLGGPRMD